MVRKGRKGGRKYSIRHSDPYFHAGTLPNGKQILLGLHLPAMVAVLFDAGGEVLRTERRKYSFKLQTRTDGSYLVDDAASDAMMDDLREWESEMGFRQGKISVKRFALHDLFIGLRDLPKHYED